MPGYYSEEAYPAIAFQFEADGAATSGDCDINSEVLHRSTDDYIRIPKGMKLKIKSWHGSGAGATDFIIEFAKDGSTYEELARLKLTAAGDIQDPHPKRPMEFKDYDGDQRFRVAWTQGTAAVAALTLLISICPIDDYE